MHTICLPLLLFIAGFLFRRRSSSFSGFSPYIYIQAPLVNIYLTPAIVQRKGNLVCFPFVTIFNAGEGSSCF
ncbi:hypothetical protein ES288_D02G000100v1 [Gossypium darwinii]|uniref:Secreted protein n=1 Tax=Gossypium darwinii TaxID=34276 RepID=A0A5D2D9J7_GOSDA|nr:hypothetical protein ES288_D02G000100v1 [Gossypium darwinii]